MDAVKRLGVVLFLCVARTTGLAGSAAPAPTMAEFIGINGHTVQFKPELYAPVARQVRDYHPVEWDLGTDPSKPPPWPAAKNRVDWNTVYGGWRQHGFTINACLMFESVARERWTRVPAQARAYGRQFAKAFGPDGLWPHVASVEIGNEPGTWTDRDYRELLGAMAQGLREGDPRLAIATCALTAGPSHRYAKSVTCLDGVHPLIDVLTVHSYPELEGWPTWRRSHPEDPALKRFLPDILDLCAWRDKHMPDTPVWVTEFGYDSSTRPAPASGDFKQWVGVSDQQQAQWLVRATLVLSSLPVERAFVYFFNDKDEPQVHGASGLTRNFQPKPAYHAMAHLRRALGAFRFAEVLREEPGRVRIQSYRGSNETVWVAWSPTGNGRSITVELPPGPGRLTRLERMPFTAGPVPELPRPDTSRGPIRVTLDESPLYLFWRD